MPKTDTATPADTQQAAETVGTSAAVSSQDIESILASPLSEDQGTSPDETEGLLEDEQETSEETKPEGQSTNQEGKEESSETTTETTQEEPLAYDRLLPLEQFGKDEKLSERLMAAAAKKWSIPEEALSQAWVEPFLRDKINTDIFVKNEQFDRKLDEFEEKAKEAETVPQKDGENHAPVAGMSQVLEQMGNFVEPMITDEGAKAFSDSMGKAWADLSEAQESGDEKRITAAQRNLVKQNLQWASVANVSLLEKMLPILVDQRIQQFQSGQQQAQQQYETAMNSLAEDPRYKDVLDLAESGKLDEVAQEFPELFQKQFKDESGKPLPAERNLREQIRRAITIIRGQNYKPAEEQVTEALKTGEKLADQRQRAREIGKGLGSGRSSGAFGDKGNSDEDFVKGLTDAFDARRPLG
jgi:hypothetical protein